jgi:hypothetical protein
MIWTELARTGDTSVHSYVSASDLFKIPDLGVSMSARKLVNVVVAGLAWELQDIRNQRDLSLELVCDPLKWQQSKLSRMENGQQCISDIDLGTLCAVYGVTGEERSHLLRMAERQDDPGYWETYSPTTVESRTRKRLERITTALVDVTTVLIPALAQTADYARAVLESEGTPPEQITARLDALLARQTTLTERQADLAMSRRPLKVDLIVGETALRRPIGGRDVMTEQLRVLLKVAQRAHVRLRVVPCEVGGDAGLHTAFTVMEFPRTAVVHLPHPTTSLFLEQDNTTDVYQRRVARLASVALNPAESMDLIADITREFESAGNTRKATGARFHTTATR